MARRPIRDWLENNTEEVEPRFRGNVGDGNIVGASGYLVVQGISFITGFVPGLRRPGFTVVSRASSVEDGVYTDVFEIDAASRDVAEFVASYFAAPSTSDYITSEKEVNSEVIEERSTYSRYRITVITDLEPVY
jgi:hypothetical protein